MNNEDKQKLAGKVARAHDLLVYGIFPGSAAKDVIEAREFLQKMHEEMLKDIDASKSQEEAAKEEAAEGTPNDVA